MMNPWANRRLMVLERICKVNRERESVGIVFSTQPERIEENKFINQVRSRVALWRQGGYQGITKTTRFLAG
jgi:hypothetical protein